VAKKLILGLGGSAHDFSTVLMEGNNILCGIEDERLTRKKNGVHWWYEIPCKLSSDYCLQYSGKQMSNIDYIVTSDIMPVRIQKHFPGILYYNHHLLHAASIYYYTKFDDIAVLVMDGWGSILEIKNQLRIRETISFFECSQNKISLIGRTTGKQPIEENSFSMGISNSLGYFYNLFTRAIGFEKFEEGKTMGLAGYGTPRYLDLLMRDIKIGNTFGDLFSFDPLNNNLIHDIDALIQNKHNSFQVKADIAASSQKVFESVLFKAIDLLIEKGFKHIGLAGGCALNSVANGKLLDYLTDKGKKLIIFPHISDAGIAFGAAAYQYHKGLPGKVSIKIKENENEKKIYNVARNYSPNEILEAINHFYPKIEYEMVEHPEKKIAQLLENSEIIAFFHGGSEFGPRALGHRSILANPQNSRSREILNRHVKFREPFRPIAPIVLDTHYSEFFEGDPERPFMLEVAGVKPDKINWISSVVHIDKTARVQTVFKDLNPLLYKILEEFYLLTGLPVLINTSFNQKGEPIVETPFDALNSFLKMKIDYLYLDGYIIRKTHAQ